MVSPPRLVLPILFLLLGSACKPGDDHKTIRIQIQFSDSVPAAVRAQMQSLRLAVTGAESWGVTLPATAATAPFRFTYYPGVEAGALEFLAEALGADGGPVAVGMGAVADVASVADEILTILLDVAGPAEPTAEPGPDAAADVPPDGEGDGEAEPVADGGTDADGDAAPDADAPADGPVADGPGPDVVLDGPPAKLGDPCVDDKGCASAHCVRQKTTDTTGVCCDKVCVGSCESCQLTGKVGVCALVAAGSDPREQCAMDTVDPCGLDGMCDGLGACRKQVVGTVCTAGTCSAALTYTTPRTCDGSGVCRPAMTVDCSPFKCGVTGCKTTCAGDGDCAPGKSCITGSCGLKPNGAGCAVDGECSSGKCRQSTCCPTDCGGCSSCGVPGSLGACIPAAGGTDPNGVCSSDACHDGSCNGSGACKVLVGATCASSACKPSGLDVGDFTCTAAGACVEMTSSCNGFKCAAGACKTTCSGPLDCAPTHNCSAGSCVPKLATGAACTADVQCLTNFCRDGYCCDADCGAVCKACSKTKKGGGSNGACGPIAIGTDPDGECGLTYCSGAMAGGCLAACAGGPCSVDCKSTAYCQLGAGGSNACALKQGTAATCTAGCECSSNTCGTYYRDSDGDNHGRGGATTLCSDPSGGAPPSYSTVGDDCCDDDKQTFPGNMDWYPDLNGCGSYDYDCSMVDELELPEIHNCSFGSCLTGCVAKGNHLGWKDSTPPSCGDTGTWVTSCSPTKCVTCGIADTSDVQQRCH